MKIQELGTKITSVPGIEYIRIEPDEASERGVHVMIKFDAMQHPLSFGMNEFGEFCQALEVANQRVQWLAEHQGN